jgi:hypothetical protein
MRISVISKRTAVRGLATLGILDAVLSVRRRLNSAFGHGRARVALARFRPVAGTSGPGLLVVRRNLGWAVADVRTAVTSHDLMTENLALARRLLEQQGVPFFFVPTAQTASYRLGVEIRYRSTVTGGLAGFDWPPSAFLMSAPLPTSNIVPARHLTARHGAGSRAHARLARSEMWALGVLVCDPHGAGVWGADEACEIEFWTPGEATGSDRDDPPEAVRSSRPNPVAKVVARPTLTDDQVNISTLVIPTATTMARYHRSSRLDFPIDVVYTWVDDTDPHWRERRDHFGSQRGHAVSSDAFATSRFTNRDELRYSLRSLAMYADFVRHVYVVTDHQVPHWLDPDAPGLTIVDHTEIFRPTDALPVFNSHAIESRLHHVPGLSEQYLYLNDDVFFGRRVHPRTFFHRSGQPYYFPSRVLIPAGPTRPDEPSVSSAAKNARDLVHAATGYLPTRKMKHTPHPQRRSLLLEIEERFADAVTPLGSSRFRSSTDVSLAASMHHHYGEAIGAAREGRIVYDYINLARSDLAALLDTFAPSQVDSFCLNDVDLTGAAEPRVNDMVRRFLDATFPFASPFEKPGSASTTGR